MRTPRGGRALSRAASGRVPGPSTSAAEEAREVQETSAEEGEGVQLNDLIDDAAAADAKAAAELLAAEQERSIQAEAKQAEADHATITPRHRAEAG